MISSQVFSPAGKVKNANNNSNNVQSSRNNIEFRNQKDTAEYLGSNADKVRDRESKSARKGQTSGQESRVSGDSKTIQANSYIDKIRKQFDCDNYDTKSGEQLQKQMKNMREMLVELNNLVTYKLNKYELATFTPKGMYVQSQP